MQGTLQRKPSNVENSKCLNLDDAQAGTVLVQFENEPVLSMKNEEYDMVLEIIGHGIGNNTKSVDIVMVLDVSQSMGADKLKAMKDAVQHLMTKLRRSDRVSIVTFANSGIMNRNFNPVTTNEQQEVENIVKSLKANGRADIGTGLRKALQVIDNRKYTNYHPTIMLISNGVQFDGNEVDRISLDRFPIFTFDLGPDKGCNSSILKDIARKSNGEYNMIDPKNPNFDVLIKCLDEFKKKPIKDVKLILKPLNGTVSRYESSQTKINHVYAGKYLVSPPDAIGSRTVSLGSLKEKERRKVLVNLSLQSVTKQVHIDSLQTFCRFRDVKGNELKTNPLIFRVKRYATPKVSQNHINQVEIAKNELVNNQSQPMKYGPYGSNMPENFRMAIKFDSARMTEVIIRHGFIVDAIGFTAEWPNGCTKTFMFGGTSGDMKKIVLKDAEYVTKISGVYGNYIHHRNQCLIGKLWIHTNLGWYGPFGQGRGVVNQRSFSSQFIDDGVVVGFCGRHNIYLESIGVFVEEVPDMTLLSQIDGLLSELARCNGQLVI